MSWRTGVLVLFRIQIIELLIVFRIAFFILESALVLGVLFAFFFIFYFVVLVEYRSHCGVLIYLGNGQDSRICEIRGLNRLLVS